MCHSTLSALIHREATADLSYPAHVVIPMHGITAFGLRQPTPVLDRVKGPIVKRLVAEVCGLQYDGRRASYEAVLGHVRLWIPDSACRKRSD